MAPVSVWTKTAQPSLAALLRPQPHYSCRLALPRTLIMRRSALDGWYSAPETRCHTNMSLDASSGNLGAKEGKKRRPRGQRQGRTKPPPHPFRPNCTHNAEGPGKKDGSVAWPSSGLMLCAISSSLRPAAGTARRSCGVAQRAKHAAASHRQLQGQRQRNKKVNRTSTWIASIVSCSGGTARSLTKSVARSRAAIVARLSAVAAGAAARAPLAVLARLPGCVLVGAIVATRHNVDLATRCRRACPLREVVLKSPPKPQPTASTHNGLVLAANAVPCSQYAFLGRARRRLLRNARGLGPHCSDDAVGAAAVKPPRRIRGYAEFYCTINII